MPQRYEINTYIGKYILKLHNKAVYLNKPIIMNTTEISTRALVFNNTELTEESILKARREFADNQQDCIDDVLNGEVRVNDPEDYCEWRRNMAEKSLAGEYDHTFAFLQSAYYIQTGECIAFLPK